MAAFNPAKSAGRASVVGLGGFVPDGWTVFLAEGLQVSQEKKATRLRFASLLLL